MKKQQKNKKTYVLAVVLVSIALIAGYFSFAYANKSLWPFAQSPTSTSDSGYTPPTETEIQSSQDGKKNSANNDTQQSDTTTSSDEKQTASVDISYASLSSDKSSIDIRAFTTDVIEGTGNCTATLTKGSQQVDSSTTAFIDATSSICSPIEIPLDKFPSSGTWSLVVTYTSPTHTGSSSPISVEVKR